MRQKNRFILMMAVFFILINMLSNSTTVFAWGDNGGGRPAYTVEEINNGALGDKIVFNSINVSEPIGGDERAFVAARENTGINAGIDNKWTSINDVKVEDGKEYIVRMYVHNNNPKGTDAVAEDTKVAFSIPDTSSTAIEVNGLISSSNATPDRYWDYVRFISDSGIPFHLEYIEGSALLENNGIGASGGIQLSDNIVNAKSAAEGRPDGGVLIGYDTLDGRVPGCYQYANYVTIRVKVIYDYEFLVETKVRLADSEDTTWQDTIDAQVGDKVEFQFQYLNTSTANQAGVVMRDLLPSNLRYVEGSTILYNGNHPNGLNADTDDVINGGVNVGSYDANANAFIRITAEVVDDNLACGGNTLINWAQVRVGDITIQDSAQVIVVVPENNWFAIAGTVITFLILLCIVFIIMLRYKIRTP